ncbi:Tricalbin-2 [Dipsacomyces acuminosporus]|nr:Tricalbin-2 [Dipsacomyces acuminosporus]
MEQQQQVPESSQPNMPREHDDPVANGAPPAIVSAPLPPIPNMPKEDSDQPTTTSSSRFRSAALGALSVSKSSSPAPPIASSPIPAANGVKDESAGETNGITHANPDSEKPAAANGIAGDSSQDQPHINGTCSDQQSVAGTSTPLTSKAIYDIARTKILTQRTLYRLSTETGYIKLRARPAAKAAASGASVVSGQPGAATTAANGTAADTPGKPAANGTATPSSAATEAAKGVAGWKEKGALDSGKKTAPQPAQPSVMDTISMYVEMIDRTGMWRNCAGVFGLMFLTYILTTFSFGLFGLAIAATFGAQWYRNSVVRFRRAVRDDMERAYERTTITRTLESVGWLNEFTTRFWLMFEPSLSRMVIDQVDPILAQNTPGFLDSLRLTTFTLGTKAPRIDGVRTYSELEDRNVIVMDWQVSFTPNDLADVPAVLRENRVNPKVVLTVRVGKGIIGAGMPIMVEDMVFKGKMQVKLQLGPVFPHVRTATVCFLERPTIDFVLKPVGGETFGVDIAHIPGLRTFILDMIHSTIGPMFYAPNHFTVDVEQIISGAVAKIPSAKGVLVIHMNSARGLPKMDTFGQSDPYVKISSIKHPEISVRTRTIEKTLTPSWGETLILLAYSKTDTIQFEVFDWNSVGKDEKIGFVSYPMQKMLEQPELEGVTMPIMMGERERGQLTFDMSYFPVATRTTQAAAVDAEGNPLDPSAEAAAAAARGGSEEPVAEAEDDGDSEVDSNTGLLRLFVRSASDLAMSPALARKLCVRADAYLNKTRVIQCPEVKNTDAPSWESGKEIFVPDRDCATVRLRLVDTSNDRTIGTLKVRIDEALAHQAGENGSDWYPLEGHVKGRVRLNVKWRPILMDADIASTLGQGKKLPGPPIGFVKLTLHEGKNLKNVEAASGRKSDPYVRVMIQNQIMAKTRYINDTLNPVWNETLFIPVHRVNETMALECMDWNRDERDKPLGEAMLKVGRLLGHLSKDENGDPVYLKTDPVEMWAGLHQRNGKIKGEIRFRASFVPAINFDDMLSTEDKARGTLDMKLSDGGLVLGEEEEDDASVANGFLRRAGSTQSSSSSDSDKPNETNAEKSSSLLRGINPIKMATTTASKVSGAIPNAVNPLNIAPAAAARIANTIPLAMPNSPQDDYIHNGSIFSGTAGTGGDSMSQALARYPRLPNIDYSRFNAGVMSVAIIGCRSLLRPFAGVFVNVYLNGNTESPMVETQPSRRRGREHVWENEFSQAAIAEAQHDVLTFDVKCRPAGASAHSDEMISIGKADFSVSELIGQKLVNSTEPVWLPLDSDTGEVLVLLRYDPVEDPQLLATESITNQGDIRIRIASASNLPAADKSGTSDPYVVAMLNGVKVWKSEPIKKTLNPKWNQQTEVGIRERSKGVLTLEVFDWNQIQSHTLLGSVTIPLSELPVNEPVEKDYPLEKRGNATIHLRFMFKPCYVQQHDDSSPILLNVAQTVVAAPVTVLKGGASVVGTVVGGIFGKFGGKKANKKAYDSDDEQDKILSPAATEALKQATNMPGDADAAPTTAAAAAVGAAGTAGSPANRAAAIPGVAGSPSSNRTPKHSRSQHFTPSGSSTAVAGNTIPMPPLRDSIDAFPAPGMLHVFIKSAHYTGSKNKKNLVASIELNHKSIFKTRVVKDVVSAEWDEKLPLPVLQGGAPVLTAVVKDHSSFRGDKHLYEFTFSPFETLKDEILASNGLVAGPKELHLKDESGSIRLVLDFAGKEHGSGEASFETSSLMGSIGRRDKHHRRSSAFSRKSASKQL